MAVNKVIRDPTPQPAHLREIAGVLAAGYLRRFAQRGDVPRSVPAGQEPPISVDSCGQQSVNWVDQNGERDA